MSTLHQALALQELLEQVGERIKDNPRGRSYLSPDAQAFVLAIGGDRAAEMQDFMTAVGQYLHKVRYGHSDTETAREELTRAFEEWLGKQQL
jgi:hypothetical protein